MDLHLWWALSYASFALLAVAATGAAWCIWRRCPREAATGMLCASIAALAAHYGCMAVDASMHGHAAPHAPTAWAAFGQVALLMSGGFFLLFLLDVLDRWTAPTPLRSTVTRATRVCVGSAILLMLGLGSALAVAVFGDASAEHIDGSIEHIVRFPGRMLMALGLIAPFGLLGALFEEASAGPLQARSSTAVGRGTDDPAALAMRASAAISPTPRIRRLSWAFLWVAWMVSSFAVEWTAQPTPRTMVAASGLRLALLPTLLAFVHLHAPFVFFDVLVKRGLLWTGVALVVTGGGMTLQRALGPLGTDLAVATACVIATVVVCVSATFLTAAEAALDRVLFRRPHYGTALRSATEAMARCSTRDALTATVTTSLAKALHAAYVRVADAPPPSGGMTVAVDLPRGTRGFFHLGPRAQGQPYGSEDLTFVHAVAAHYAAHIEAFDARLAAEAVVVAELKALRAQINPHFLFNALTLVAELAQGDARTERTVLNLSEVFRYVLASTQHDRVPLAAEVAALRAYLEIHLERFDGRVQVQIAIDDDVQDLLVPPMLLQPLVENAVTHGLAGRVRGSTIRIRAARHDHAVTLVVEDDGDGYDVARVAQGIGLRNVCARVQHVGGLFEIRSAVGEGTRATLTLPEPP